MKRMRENCPSILLAHFQPQLTHVERSPRRWLDCDADLHNLRLARTEYSVRRIKNRHL